MTNGTEAAGFGGIRHYRRGVGNYTPIIGITTRDESVQKFANPSPPSYGVYLGNYATDPAVLPDGRLIISWAKDVAQDYGLYTINPDGSGLALLYDNPGTTEVRTQIIRQRAIPAIIPDKVTKVASLLPPLVAGPYDIDGTYTFQALNVYFNAPVDVDILNAMPVGSANTIRFFIDHQRSQQRGSHESLDWPILIREQAVNPDGSVTVTSPANVPLFEQIRTRLPDYIVPLVGRTIPSNIGSGAAHVAGENFGRPGEVQRCVGCHAGHSMIPVPANPADAQWTNLAPGATISVSSTGSGSTSGLIDRRVKMALPIGYPSKYWVSSSGNPAAQWVQLAFPVPVTVRTVRLYNIPRSDSQIQILNTTVRLYSDAAGTTQVASNTSGSLSENGTDVAFSDVLTRVVRVEFNSVNGSAAGLGEVEVIARGEAENAVGLPTATSTLTSTPTITTTPDTLTPTMTLTSDPMITETFTPTLTPTLAPAGSPTSTQTPTDTPVSAFTPTLTSTSTPTVQPAITSTQTSTSTPTSTFTIAPPRGISDTDLKTQGSTPRRGAGPQACLVEYDDRAR